MCDIFKTKNIAIILFYLIIGFLFFVQDKYAISQQDDYLYQFVVPDVPRPFTESLIDPTVERQPIQTVSDVITSNLHAYKNSNGRFLVHCIVQFCCSFMNMDTFVVLNTFVFLAFIFFVVRVARIKDLWQMALVVCFFWLLMYKGLSFFGNRANAVNYLWCSVANLLFLSFLDSILKQSKEKYSQWYYLVVFLFFGVLIGSLSESFSIGISAALFVHTFLYHKKLSKSVMFLIFGYFIGTAVVVFAPGNFLRVEGRGMGSFNYFVLYQILTLPVNFVYILLLSLLGYINKRELVLHLKENTILIMAVLFSAFFMMFIAYNGKHQQTAINVICLVLVLRILFSNFGLKTYHIKIMAIALCVISLMIYIPVLKLRKSLYDSYTYCISTVNKGKKGMVLVDEDYEKAVYKLRTNSFINNYFVFVLKINPRHVSMIKTKGKDLDFVSKIIPFPLSKIDSYCVEDNKVIDNVYRCDYNYHICKLNKDVPLDNVTLEFKESFGLFFRRNSISQIHPDQLITYKGAKYYLFCLNSKNDEIVSLTVI